MDRSAGGVTLTMGGGSISVGMRCTPSGMGTGGAGLAGGNNMVGAAFHTSGVGIHECHGESKASDCGGAIVELLFVLGGMKVWGMCHPRYSYLYS